MQDALWEWDDDKAERNRVEHGVSFADAQAAFHDPHQVIFYDDDHSTATEPRFIGLGLTPRGLLFVSYTMVEGRTRIISARRANKAMEGIYEEERGQ